MILLTITATDPAYPEQKVESTFTDSAWVESGDLADETIIDLLSRLNDRLGEKEDGEVI